MNTIPSSLSKEKTVAELINALIVNGKEMKKTYGHGEVEYLWCEKNNDRYYFYVRGWGSALGKAEDRLFDLINYPSTWTFDELPEDAQQLQPPGTSDAVMLPTSMSETSEFQQTDTNVALLEAIEEGLEKLTMQPYPPNIFKPISQGTWREINEALMPLGISVDRIAGHVGRQVRELIIEQAKALLNMVQKVKGSDTTMLNSSHVADNQNNQENREK
jgi:hypothetical protein